MKASLGRVVLYPLTDNDADRINARREDAEAAQSTSFKTGQIIHVGNKVAAGEIYPMIITRVWDDNLVNGQVLLDGNDTYWVTSTHQDDEIETRDTTRLGFWFQPPRV